MPSLTLLGQAVVSGLLAGGLYGLLALGLSLSWGLLRLVNLGALRARVARRLPHLPARHRRARSPPWLAVLPPSCPLFFAARRRAARRLRLLPRHRVHLAARHLRPHRHPRVADPVVLDGGLPPLRDAVRDRLHPRRARCSSPPSSSLACLTAAVLALGTWAWLRFTYVGKALRASAEDPAIAAAFGVNHRRAGLPALRRQRGLRRGRRRLHRADLHAGARRRSGRGSAWCSPS